MGQPRCLRRLAGPLANQRPRLSLERFLSHPDKDRGTSALSAGGVWVEEGVEALAGHGETGDADADGPAHGVGEGRAHRV